MKSDLSKGNPILRIITQLDCYLTRNDSQWTLSTSREQADSPSGKLSWDLWRLAWAKGMVKIIKDVCLHLSRDRTSNRYSTRTSIVLCHSSHNRKRKIREGIVETITWKESENVGSGRNNRRSFGGQRSENIVALYKSEQGAYNGACSRTK